MVMLLVAMPFAPSSVLANMGQRCDVADEVVICDHAGCVVNWMSRCSQEMCSEVQRRDVCCFWWNDVWCFVI